MTKTTNYQLNQWAKSDRIMMDDFNSDNKKIDAALAALKVSVGTYTGTGDTNTQQITLGFQPRIVLILPNRSGLADNMAALLFPDKPQINNAQTNNIGTITPTGFEVTEALNRPADIVTYHYIVIR